MRKMFLLIALFFSLLSMSARTDNIEKRNDCDGYYAMTNFKTFWPLIGVKKYYKDIYLPILDFQSAKGKATMHFVYSSKTYEFIVRSLGNGVYEIESVKNKMKLYSYIKYDSEWSHTYYMSFFEKYDGKNIPDKREIGSAYSPSQWKEDGWDDLEVMKKRRREGYEKPDHNVTPINENTK